MVPCFSGHTHSFDVQSKCPHVKCSGRDITKKKKGEKRGSFLIRCEQAWFTSVPWETAWPDKAWRWTFIGLRRCVCKFSPTESENGHNLRMLRVIEGMELSNTAHQWSLAKFSNVYFIFIINFIHFLTIWVINFWLHWVFIAAWSSSGCCERGSSPSHGVVLGLSWVLACGLGSCGTPGRSCSLVCGIFPD